jgi:pimeloyl-ACP methyl ester carboxylesterase
MSPSCYTAADGARLAYADQGHGPAVLCLAGLTRNGADFNFLAPHLEGYRLIRPDYRGRGASAWTGAETYTVPQEAADALSLLDHLSIDKAAIIGTSRGGIIGMFLAATAKARLSGLCLNDIGPVIERKGLENIAAYVGRRPASQTLDDIAARMPSVMAGFANVPPQRWRAFVDGLYIETPSGLGLRYDPALRQSFLASMAAPDADLWPLFDATAGLPMALIRGQSSDLLSSATAAEMCRRRPDMIFAEIPDRAHVPFLDEPAALDAIHEWLGKLA